MASQTPIAVRYLGLVPTIKGFDRNLAKELGGSKVRSIAGNAGGGIGTRLVSGMSKTLKVGALAAGGAVAGILGTAVVKGFGRLNAIENAEAKLTGLGNSATATSKIMDDALAAVKGTAFGMDEAATTAASAVAAGLKPGKELESYLRLVGDAATIAGTDMSSMGSIFNKVATSGKVQGDVFAQLGDMGIPIVTLLAEEMGKSAGEIYKLGSAGKIGTDEFLAAMSSMSGAALEGGNTTTGAFKNMGAALSRLGATLLGGVYPLIGPFFNQITALIDGAAEAVTPFLEQIQPLLEAGAQKVLGYTGLFTESLGGILAVLREGDFDPSQWAKGVEEDHPLVNFAFNVREGFLGIKDAVAQIPWGEISAFLSPIVSGFQALAPVLLEAWQNLSPLSLVFDILRPVLPEIGAAVGQLAQILAGVLGSALQAVLPAVSQLVGALGPLVAELVSQVLPAVLEVASGLGVALIPVIQAVGPLLSAVVGALVPLLGQVVAVAGPLVSMLAKALAPVLVVIGVALGGLIKFLTPIIALLVRFSPVILGVVGAVIAYNRVMGIVRLVSLAAALGQTTFLGAISAATIGVVRQRIATIASTVATRAMTIGQKAAAAATWLLNAAMRANPIGLIITGITLLVGALVLFFTKTETGRKVWETVWGAIKTAAKAVGDWFVNTLVPAFVSAWEWIKTAAAAVGNWFTTTLVPILKAAWEGIAAGAIWLYQNVIQPVWKGIRIAIAVVVTAILVYIDLLKFYWTKILAPAAIWLYQNVIKPVWEAIKTAIAATVAWVRDVGWPILKAAWDAIALAAQWLYNTVILPVWNAIKAAIKAVIDWFQKIGWPALQLTIKWIGDAFKWVYNSVIKPVWAAIRSAIDAVVAWFKNTAWPLINTVIGWLKMSFEGWKLIAKTVWAAVKAAIKAVSDWLTGTLWPAIKGVIDKLKSGFNTMRDSIKAAWKYVQDKAIAPVANWLTGTLKPKIDTLTDNIKTAFSTMKDNVLKAWDKIKEGLKKPINGIIDIYTEHIKGNFDSVAKKLGLDTRLPPMTGFATGGYTGRGAKYTPAGIVHADEYVIRKESQNDLRRQAPGFLDALNKHGAKALGYASGGLVKLRMPFAGSYPRGEGFGARGGRHKGIDYPMPSGAVLKAVGAGHVRHTRNAAAGNKLELVLGDGLVAGYHHLSSYIAKAGSSVGRGADVARVGSTGRSSGPHLHFSLKRDGKYVDPAPYLAGGGSAGTGGGGDWWNPFDGLWSKIKGGVSEVAGAGVVGEILTKTVSNSVDWAKEWVTGKLSDLGDWGAEQVEGAANTFRAARWTPVSIQALRMENEYSRSNLNSLLRRMEQESGFNPQAINKWDSNARRGTPSKGLMQVIDPTFRAYAHPAYNKNIWDPLSNILASIRYARAAYGSPARGWNRKGGYADGGWTGPGSKYTPAGVVHADEFVVQKSSRRSIESARPGFLDRLNRHGAAALAGYAGGGLVGYASGGRVSPNAKIGSSKVTVILDGLVGTEKQVKTAAGKLADGIAKTFQDRFKANQKQTVDRLSDSLKALKAQASQLNKTVNAKTSSAKRSTVNRLSDDLADLRKQAKRLDSKKQAKQLAAVRKQIESTQTALTKARRGDYSAAASATASKLKDVQKQIASTEAALKQARRGNTSAAATKAADAFYTKYAASATAKLQDLAKRSDTLTAKLKDAKAALTEAAKVRDDYAASMTEKFSGAYALTGDSATTGIETIIRGFRNSASTVKTFTKQLGELKTRGLSMGLIDQIAQLGAEEGSKVATNLLTGTDAQIKEITKQYNSLNKVSTASGKTLGQQMYQSGVDSARGYVNGLTSQLKAVNAASEALANNVVSTVRRKLGIKSPSRVFDAIAGYTVDGFVNRIQDETARVRKAMVVMQTPPEPGEFGSPAGAALTPRRGVTITGGNFGYDPESIGRGINREERKQALLYTY